MSFYGIGTTEDKRRPEILRLCRQHSQQSVREISARLGTGEVVVEWSSTPTLGIERKESLIAAIEAAADSFEALDVPLTYSYRAKREGDWERVERHVFRNLLRSDLQTWHEVRNHPD